MGRSFGLVIFDCDGVLVDSEPAANRVFSEALREIGIELTPAECARAFKGLSLGACGRLIESRFRIALPQDFFQRLQRRTFETFERELRPVEGIEDALSQITTRVCVASSGSLEKMRFTLGLTGLLRFFEGRLFSADQVRNGKPHPDLFVLAAAMMNERPESAAVVEDSVPGVKAARSAGMTVFGYGSGPAEAAQLSLSAALVFTSMRDLPRLLQGGR